MPRIRLDRSRYHSTVHGERTPDDPLANVHYYQDGLPFDAAGHVVEDVLSDEQKGALERKSSKQAPAETARSRESGNPAEILDSRLRGNERDADDPDAHASAADAPAAASAPPADEPVNLELWLTGKDKYLFDQVQAAIRARYSKTVNTVTDAVEFLVLEQSLVALDKVSKKLAPSLTLPRSRGREGWGA